MTESPYITDPNWQYRDPDGCRNMFFAILVGIVVTVILCLVCPSCASTKNVEKAEVVENNTTLVTDETTTVEQTDTSHTEEHSTTTTESGTEITFGQGGGTYNSKTGEATNVTSVRENATSHEQSDKIEDLSSRIAILQHSNDSLSSQVATYQSELTQERKVPKRTGYDRFCSWWFWITAILLLVKIAAWIMEKYPATAPWVAIVRKFVPVL